MTSLKGLVVFLAAGSAGIALLLVGQAPDVTWVRVDFDEILEFRSPVPLTRTPEQGIDSAFATWAGPSLNVRMDYGLFSDPLTSHDRQEGFRVVERDIDGFPARIVTFTRSDGIRFTGAHFASLKGQGLEDKRKLTAVVEAGPDIEEDVPQKMLESIVFQKGEDP